MGGKTKQRVKNNARPSSSSRSAELVGSTGFVGFAAHADLGIVPYVPGFSTLEAVSETFDGNISTEFQLVFRKMSKKDPITKKRALQEFVELVNKSDLEENKPVLPVWPKFYQNLSTDTEHMVRELAQTALKTLVSKCKRNVAPFLKQMVPHWLMSQFDNYAPSASIATLSFRETFAGNVDRTQEVLIHCQMEIISTAMRYLTYHTPSTLSNGKGMEPEEAERKYQRCVVGTLKMLSYFIEKTRDNSENGAKVVDNLKELVENKKFWSLSTHKGTVIRAAWFELIYNIMQSTHFKEILEPIKRQLTSLCFQNIDHTDASIASLTWGCVLLIQDSDEDWHTSVNLQVKILPKIYKLIRNGFNRNATAIAPNLLPFFSKLTPDIFEENNYYKFCERFFSEFKESITIESPYSTAEMSAIIRTNFECLRYLSQKLNQSKERSSEQNALEIWIIKDNLIETVIWFLDSKCHSVKSYFQELSALVAFWSSQSGIDTNDNKLYTQLLETFWQLMAEKILSKVKNEDVTEKYLQNLSLLLQDLHTANPNMEKQKIKFCDQVLDDAEQRLSDPKHESPNNCVEASKSSQHNRKLFKELKCFATHLGHLCMEISHERQSIKYIKIIRHLIRMFNDEEFFKSLNSEGTITETLNSLKSSLQSESADEEMQELLVNVIFEILQNLEAVESLEYIKNYLLEDSRGSVKILVLQRLLAHPFCNEPAVRDIIAQSNVSSLILEIAREALMDDTKEKLNILHKCFFQVETGEILINQSTVDGILKIFCEELFAAEEKNHVIDGCGSFLAQTMPVFCAGDNASKNVKNSVFLHLFEITIKYLESNDSISQDTLWEITTCWQDTLSSGDISLDETIMRSCCHIIDKYIQRDNLKPTLVDNMGDALSKLIMCSTEHIKDKDNRQIEIDHTIETVFYSKVLEAENISKLEDLCDILEATKCINSPGSSSVNDNCLSNVQIIEIFKRSLLNLSTLKKLICKVQPRAEPSEEECSEDYCDINENLLTEWSELTLRKMMQYLRVAAIGDSIINNSLYPLDPVIEEFILILSETVKVIMSSECDIIATLCESLIESASKEGSNRYCRVIPYILHTSTYTHFEENSTIILEETLCNRFIDKGSFEAYISCLQYLLPHLSSKAITMQNPIMRCEPPQSWIKAAMFRCLIENNFDNVASNEINDKSIPMAALHLITDMVERNQNNKEILLYNTTLHDKPFANIVNIIELINLFAEIVEKFPYQMSLKHWDSLRLGLSSWTLTASKNLTNFSNPAVFLFIARVLVLYGKLKSFILKAKQKSSTTTISNVIDEWENLFARDVDLVLFKIFFKLCDENENSIDSGCYALLMEQIVPAVNLIDYNFVYSANKELNRVSDLCNFLLKRLSNSFYYVRICCAHILRQMIPYFVAEDVLNFEKNSVENFSAHSENPIFHFLNYFDDYLMRYSLPITKYLQEFSFKLTEINEFSKIERNEALSYFLLWDCIIQACAKSPVSLRSIYTSWLHENRHEENFLHFLFRAMPTDILKNHDSKSLNADIFKSLDFSQIIQDSKITIEKFACHMYTEILSKLPALVRKWWNGCPSRQKTFVDKLTSNFVSTLIVSEELKAITNRKDKHENMQVTIHNSTREVLAVYSIDEARMELVITLPPNYPLGAVKVECGKQIGGRSSSRNIGMQLSIFLTHQNGTICDGLTLWKGNLDKKFEGVEECYICYTVIHQDTCQLPKQSCKTCKKKFHGPCLYKWFTTSSKSSCPICRNVF